MKALKQPLLGVAGLDDLKWKLGRQHKGILSVSGCLDSQKSNLTWYLTEDRRVVLIVTENEQKAREFLEDYRLYDPEVLYYPPKDMIFYQADMSGNLLARQRMKVIQALTEQKKVTIVTSTGGCMDYLLPLCVFKNEQIRIDMDAVIDLDELTGKLAFLGYERCGQVEAPGQFSVRGGILDIFSFTEESPFRVELWGDEIDSIRSFDPESQRSVENLDGITIFAASEELGYQGKELKRRLTDTLLDYLPEEHVVILDEPGRILENAEALSKEYTIAMERRVEAGKMVKEEVKPYAEPALLGYRLNRLSCIALSLMDIRKAEWEVLENYHVTVNSVSAYQNQFPLLVKDLHRWKKAGYCMVLLSESRTRGRRLADELQNEGFSAFFSENPERMLQQGEVLITVGSLRKGFEYPIQKFVFIAETDIFGRIQKKKKKKTTLSGDRIQSFAELTVGDFVVHESHGLGIYKGIEKVTVDHVVKDYIKIEYAGGSSLYIQPTGLDCLQKYGSADGKKPKLNKLGTQEWKKTRTRVRGAVKDMAKELVALYAARQENKGFRYGEDTLWQREFEELFPFEETEDQLQAIQDTKADMESDKIMDRLICGDVGYGKTEIAIRAAFKAVQENKQVAFLAPTTILAQQHYNTFVQRMKDFPVRIDLMCRFRSAAQQRKTVEDLKKGFVDILIGTHRLLSKDVAFKALGLLVVDEEQRFGVAHKERIKQLKSNVDVLTLSATPIPRTLHMSLVGIRDMSVLEEAPVDRTPIQTYCLEYDEELVREAISRELARDGQVYYVYNRVSGIADLAARLKKLLPEAEIAFAHGQMKEQELEKIMYRFVEGEIDVLVSTTIIETGLDIANVNTILVHDADRLGLSQLYQLRGRVGRSNRTAYAFLMYQRNRLLKEEAEKRLHAISEYTELGSGVKIALRDLEIRGAGNVLGAEQHGHMEAVGYDLYCKMLSEAVREEKGLESEEDFETSIDLQIDAYIPPAYIRNESQKLDIYKRIAGLETREEMEDMQEELIDRFGDPPKSVLNLLMAAELKAKAHRVYVTEIRQNSAEFQITLYERAKLDGAKIPLLFQKYGAMIQFKPDVNPYFILKPMLQTNKKRNLLEDLRNFLEDLTELLLTEEGKSDSPAAERER